jgi:hypothetical protein
MTDKPKHKREVILRNSAQCLECGKVLESFHRHDCKVCGCDNSTMVDGGKEYIRRGYKSRNKVLELSVIQYEDVPCSFSAYDGKCYMCEFEKRYPESVEPEPMKQMKEDIENG